MLAASEAFHNHDYPEAIRIYTLIIDTEQEHALSALLNRASARYTHQEYELAAADAHLYLQKTRDSGECKPQSAIILADCLRKNASLRREPYLEALRWAQAHFITHLRLKQQLGELFSELQAPKDE